MKHLGGNGCALVVEWIVECHPGTKRFVGLHCLDSFQCNLLVYGLCQDGVSCGGSFCGQTKGW